MAKVLYPNGVEAIRGRLSFHDCQDIVGGYVECVYPAPDLVVLVNEEGKLMGLPDNVTASEICKCHIVGTAILVEDPDEARRILGG